MLKLKVFIKRLFVARKTHCAMLPGSHWGRRFVQPPQWEDNFDELARQEINYE